MQELYYLILGGILGVLGGTLGIGGGIIAIPIIHSVFGIPHIIAQGTALVMVIPNLIMSFISYKKRNNINFKSVFYLCLISSITSYLSAKLSVSIEQEMLRKGYAVFIISVIVLQLISRKHVSCSINKKLIPIVAIACGFVSGFFAVGGALIVVPLLVIFFNLPQTKAQGIALALVIPSASTALYSYSIHDYIYWDVGLLLFIGGIITVHLGVKIAHTIKQETLKKAYTSTLCVVAILNLI